jgi:hypothetical protein
MSGSRTFVIVGAGLAGARAAETLRAEALTVGWCCSATRPSGPMSGRRCPRATWAARPTGPACACTPRGAPPPTASSCTPPAPSAGSTRRTTASSWPPARASAMTASSAGRSPWSARTPHRWPGCSAPSRRGYRELHADHGVQLQLGTRVAGLRGTGRVEAVVTEDRRTVEGDLVLVGAAVPRTGLAEAAGLPVRNGSWSSSSWRGSGCTPPVMSPPPGTPGYQRYLRVEHWANARTRARPRPATCSGARCPPARRRQPAPDDHPQQLHHRHNQSPG